MNWPTQGDSKADVSSVSPCYVGPNWLGLTFKTSAFESLYGGQFTLSAQLIKPNYLTVCKLVFARNLITYIQIILVSLTYIVLILVTVNQLNSVTFWPGRICNNPPKSNPNDWIQWWIFSVFSKFQKAATLQISKFSCN